ncbi:MAG: DUF1573 domain-containing protein [Thermodesulfobacteriota bacterium]
MAARFVAIVTAVLLFPATVAAGEPRLDMQSTKYDMGKVYYGDKSATAFEFVNTGDAPLIIDRVRVSCGCTKATADPSEVPPGARGRISVSYDSHGQHTGPQTKIVSIHSNDPRTPEVELRLAVDVVRELEVTPSSLARRLKTFQEEIALAVKIANHSDAEVTITGAKAYGPAAHVDVNPPTPRIGPKSTGEVGLILRLEGKPRFRIYLGRIVLATDHHRETDVRLNYMVEIQAPESRGEERRARHRE